MKKGTVIFPETTVYGWPYTIANLKILYGYNLATIEIEDRNGQWHKFDFYVTEINNFPELRLMLIKYMEEKSTKILN